MTIKVDKIGAYIEIPVNHPSPPLTRRTRIRWRIEDIWDRRPRVHLGPCDHDGCC